MRGDRLGFNTAEKIIRQADDLVKTYHTRDPLALANALGITVIPFRFHSVKGMYTSMDSRNAYIFYKEDLDPYMRSIVLAHEIGHHMEHRSLQNAFREFRLFDQNESIMEYEANLFAAELLLPDEEILGYIHQGYSADEIAAMMNSDVNLVALKAAELNRKGYDIRIVEHKHNFLKSSRGSENERR